MTIEHYTKPGYTVMDQFDATPTYCEKCLSKISGPAFNYKKGEMIFNYCEVCKERVTTISLDKKKAIQRQRNINKILA